MPSLNLFVNIPDDPDIISLLHYILYLVKTPIPYFYGKEKVLYKNFKKPKGLYN